MGKAQYVEKKVRVTKEISELADEIADTVLSAIDVTKDGFQVDDLFKLFGERMKKWATAIQGLDQADDEAKQDPYAFSLAWAVAGQKVFNHLWKSGVLKADEEVVGALSLKATEAMVAAHTAALAGEAPAPEKVAKKAKKKTKKKA